MNLSNIKNKEQALKVLVQLRNIADYQAERDLITALEYVEKKNLWDETQYRTFDAFINDVLNFKATRYRLAQKAINELGKDVVDNIGVPASRIIVKIKDKVSRNEAISRCEEYVKKHERCPNEGYARIIVSQLSNKEDKKTRAETLKEKVNDLEVAKNRINELEAEVAGLKKENAKLKRRVNTLEKANAELRNEAA